jgi:hypothetical protein
MTTYYLDASAQGASDANSGTSTSQPFKTLSALARTFQPGDTIAIKAGTSYTGTLTVTADGTASAPITFTKYGTGADPVVSTTGQNAFSMQGANYVVVDHLRVAGATLYGVYMDANSAHNTLRNMEVSNAGFGYELLGAHDNLLTGNYVHDLHMINNTPGGNDDFGAVAFDLEVCANNELAHNMVVNAKAPSYDYGTDGGGFSFWRSVSNISIHDNVVLNSDGFVEPGGLAGDSLSNVQVYNNISANNANFCWLHNNPSTTFGVNISGFNVHNNTIYEPSAWYIAGFDGPVASGSFSFTNNLVYAPQSGQVFSQSGTYHTNNYYQASVTPSGTGETGGAIAFANPATNDFHVTSGAPMNYGAYTDGHSPGLPSAAPPPPPPSAGTLTLAISEDYYKGDAQFTVSVDGQQVGATQTAHVLHATGANEIFLLTGNWDSGQHDVKIAFINDAYSGNPSNDRNLYVDSIALNGSTYTGTSAALLSNGSRDFAVGGTVPTRAAAPDTLVLHLSEDAWKGDAQFQVSIDGKTLDTAEFVTALHSVGGSQDFTYAGNFGSGTHNVGVSFLNDAYGGAKSTDRNLYVGSVTFDTHTYAGATLLSAGTAHFSVSA